MLTVVVLTVLPELLHLCSIICWRGETTLNLGKETNTMTNYDPNQSVSSPNNPSISPSSEAIDVEGKISQVMESFPLQLMVETKDGSCYVALLPETKITQQGKTVDASNLNLGLTVTIKGPSLAADPSAMTALAIEIKS